MEKTLDRSWTNIYRLGEKSLDSIVKSRIVLDEKCIEKSWYLVNNKKILKPCTAIINTS